ncbi:MAG: HAMP domain-containing protein [Sphingobacteriales bacterium]|nr:MAG: HAMP domain-containing protein [Sphingobacteriales bacterium]
MRPRTSGIQFKIFLGNACVFLFLAFFVIGTQLFKVHSVELLEKSSSVTFPVLERLDLISRRIADQQQLLIAAAQTNDEFAMDSSKEITLGNQESLKEIVDLDPSITARVEEISRRYRSYTEQSEVMVSKALSSKSGLSGNDKALLAFMKSQEEMTYSIKQLRNDVHRSYTNAINEVTESSSRIISLGVFCVVMVFFFSFLINLFLHGRVISPIVEISNRSLEVAGGSFVKLKDTTRKDEIGILSNNFNGMIDSLKLNSKIMTLTERYGREILSAKNHVHLHDKIEEAIVEFQGKMIKYRIFVSSLLVSRNANANDFSEIKSDGILFHVDDYPLFDHSGLVVSLKSSADKKDIGHIVFESKGSGDISELVEFINALSVNIVSALDSLKLLDTLSLVGEQKLEIERTSEKLSSSLLLVQEQKNQISVLVDNIPAGFCAINEKFRIVGPYSKFLKRLFIQENLNGFDLIEALFKNSDSTKESIFDYRAVLRTGIGCDIDFFDSSKLLPRKLTWIRQEIPVNLEIDWVPIKLDDDSSDVGSVVVVIRDVTEMKALELKSFKVSQELELVSVLVEVDQNNFLNGMKDAENASRTLEGIISNEIEENRTILLRKLHTLKGTLRSLKLLRLSSIVHALEDVLVDIENENVFLNHEQRSVLSNNLKEFDFERARVNEIFFVKLKRGHISQSQIVSRDVKALIVAFDVLKTVSLQVLPSKVNEVSDKFWQLLRFGSRNFERELQVVADLTSQDLGFNHSCDISVTGVNMLFHDEPFNHLKNAFAHLVRNSIDHSIQGRVGGRITIDLSYNDSGRAIVVYRDTGKGLPLEAIKKVALSKGLIDDPFDIKKIANAIFEKGISTAAKTTSVSGRGYGMNAVRATIRDYGGTIKIDLMHQPDMDGNQKFAFIIELDMASVFLHPLSEDKLAISSAV